MFCESKVTPFFPMSDLWRLQEMVGRTQVFEWPSLDLW